MQIQQGDVCLESCVIPKTAKPTESNIVRHGESGHSHRVIGGEVMTLDEDVFVRCDADCVMIHEEHKQIVLNPESGHNGFRVLGGVYEYDYDTEERKRVID